MACRVIPIKKFDAGLLAMATLLACSAQALEAEPPLIKEVTIIGTKEANLKLSGSGVRIDADELKKHAYSDLNQLVSAVPGSMFARRMDLVYVPTSVFGERPRIAAKKLR